MIAFRNLLFFKSEVYMENRSRIVILVNEFQSIILVDDVEMDEHKYVILLSFKSARCSYSFHIMLLILCCLPCFGSATVSTKPCHPCFFPIRYQSSQATSQVNQHILYSYYLTNNLCQYFSLNASFMCFSYLLWFICGIRCRSSGVIGLVR